MYLWNVIASMLSDRTSIKYRWRGSRPFIQNSFLKKQHLTPPWSTALWSVHCKWWHDSSVPLMHHAWSEWPDLDHHPKGTYPSIKHFIHTSYRWLKSPCETDNKRISFGSWSSIVYLPTVKFSQVWDKPKYRAALKAEIRKRKTGMRNQESGIRNPESGTRNPESETTIRREKYLMVKYMTWGNKYGIKNLNHSLA